MLLTQAFDNFKHVAQWDPIVELISKWTGQSFVE